MFDDFKALADKKKELFDGDIEALVLKAEFGDERPVAAREPARRQRLRRASRRAASCCATATAASSSQESTGDGPVDAAFKAIEQATGVCVKLRKFEVRSVSSGEDAQGEAVVTVEYNGRSYRGIERHDRHRRVGRAGLPRSDQPHRVLAPPRRRPARDVARRGRLTRTTGAGMTAQTLFEKVWERHVVVPETPTRRPSCTSTCT